MNINLLQQVIEAPRVRRYANPRITRNGLSSNPVERYSFTGGTILANDVLVKHGDSFFIGGDTATYEFDMGLKVAGSVAECPVKMYYSYQPSVQAPNGIWAERTVQSDIDVIKTLNGVSFAPATTASGCIAQILLELDLTPLCNSLFGGSNSALKAALKAITCDVYAQGSGASGGVLTNGVQAKLWSDMTTQWVGTSNSINDTNSIAKRTLLDSEISSNHSQWIMSNNKLYILIASQYASDGTIPSTVQLDYFNIKIDLARTPDTVSPIQVNL